MINTKIIFETKRLMAKPWHNEQIDDLVRLHNDPDVTKYLRGRTEDIKDAQSRIALWQKDYLTYQLGKFHISLKTNGEFVGRAGFGFHQNMPDIGYALLKHYWRQGFAYEIASGLRDWFFTTKPNSFFIGYANVQNIASCRVLEKIGMSFTHIEPYKTDQKLRFYRFERADWKSQNLI